jgi:transposase-like protein
MLAKSVLECPNAPATDLAKILGVNPNTVRKWLKLPEYQRYQTWYIEKRFVAEPSPATHPDYVPAKIRQTRIKEEISEYAVEMFDRLKDIMETTLDEKLQVNVAQDLLDRAGHQAARKVETAPTAFVMTPELLRILQTRAVEAGAIQVLEGTVIGEGLGQAHPKPEEA